MVVVELQAYTGGNISAGVYSDRIGACEVK
jgi:hypothetical protein